MAQLVARLNGIQKVRGSNPLSSTTDKKPLAQPSGFFIRGGTCGRTKIFVRGLLRSNDPKVAVMSATAIPADYLIQLIAARGDYGSVVGVIAVAGVARIASAVAVAVRFAASGERERGRDCNYQRQHYHQKLLFHFYLSFLGIFCLLLAVGAITKPFTSFRAEQKTQTSRSI